MKSSFDFKILERVPLAPLTTFKIGGPARYFVRAETEGHILEAFEFAEKKQLKVFVLGGGSNILVSDAGFNGLVLQVALRGVASEPGTVVNGAVKANAPVATVPGSDLSARAGGYDPQNAVLLTAQAGEDWDPFVEHCVENGLAGVECLSGIPGFIGGTPVQNVGAYGQEVSETIVSVRCYDREQKKIIEMANADCGFSYRKSIFNSRERNRYVVLSVTYKLKKGGSPKIVYKDLKEHFAGHVPSLAETRAAVREIRRAKSMVIDASDPNSRSAGSFFKNPIVPLGKIEDLAARSGVEGVPHFPAGEEYVKIPAAWLIEQADFYNGFVLGNAGISTNHSLAIINRGGASASEIIALKNLIQSKVEAEFGILLQPEPIFVGFSSEFQL